ncbi:MAG: cytochrome b subunit of the bc complex [Clostridia bacterium]|nr:cytochrome b subunit of the bc complex [Clostridia bacterium]
MAKQSHKKSGTIPFWPNHALTEASVALFFLGGLFLLSGILPRELGETANKLATPEHILPDWYFLWMFQLLKIIPSKILGLLVSAGVFAVIFVAPWLDKSHLRRPGQRPVASLLMLGFLIAAAILSVFSLGL